MKKHFFAALAITAVSASIPWLTSCKKDKTEDINSLVYAPSSKPQGLSYAEWSQKWWTWFLQMDCENHVYFDPTGANAGYNQSGPVFFLTGSSTVGDVRNVTVPAGKDILFPLLNYINDYPCPDPAFHPAPGESLEHFLRAGAKTGIDMVSKQEVTLDGVALIDPASYRFTSGLYYFTGNSALSGCFDPCITGSVQAAVSDGYWVMLKALPRGDHQLHFHAEITPWGLIQDVTFNLKVE